MAEKISIIIGGLIAGVIAVGIVHQIHTFMPETTIGRILAIASTLIITGILYALTYTIVSNGRIKAGEFEGIYAGIFAGAVGGVLGWAIGEAIFGPFQLMGFVLTGLISGFIFSAQVDTRIQ